MELTQEKLRKLFFYDPDSGLFVFLSGRFLGKNPKNISKDGYRRLCIDKLFYQQHRLAFLYMLGRMPKEIDHVNGNRSDNRWCNLRSVNRSQNNMNSLVPKAQNQSGLRGAHYKKRTGLYAARIKVNKTEVFLGNFKTAEEAHHAYCKASRKYFGEFSGVPHA